MIYINLPQFSWYWIKNPMCSPTPTSSEGSEHSGIPRISHLSVRDNIRTNSIFTKSSEHGEKNCWNSTNHGGKLFETSFYVGMSNLTVSWLFSSVKPLSIVGSRLGKHWIHPGEVPAPSGSRLDALHGVFLPGPPSTLTRPMTAVP